MSEEDIEGLAAEYVLGCLSPAERRAVDLARPSNGALDAAVAAWERRLGPLAEGVPGVEPPPHVFAHISRRISGHGVRSGHSLALRPALAWRTVAIGSSALAAVLALVLVWTWQAPARPA